MSVDVISETADPIQSAIESAVEANSEPTDDQAEAAVEVESAGTTEAATTETEKAEKPAVEDEEAELAKITAELVAKNPGMQRGRIGVSRHQAVLTRNRNKWDEERKGLEAKLADFTTKYEDASFKRKLELISLVESDHGTFFGAMKATPAYAELIRKEAEALAKTMAPASSAPAAKADPSVPTEEPQPDVLLADGRVTYSQEQALALSKWTAAQIQGKFSTELDKVRAQVQPIVDKEKNQKEFDDAKGKLTVLVNEAIAKWPGFKENMAEIGALVQRPENVAKGMSLYQAYIEVVPNKLVQDTAAKVTAAEKAMTEKLQQRVPKESIRPGSTPVAKASADDSKTDMESVIRASMKSAGLSAA
jgi:hypothetical protein